MHRQLLDHASPMFCCVVDDVVFLLFFGVVLLLPCDIHASQQDLRESLHTTESALSAVAASFGAREDCLQRWKDTAVSGAAAGQAGDDGPLGVSPVQSRPM